MADGEAYIPRAAAAGVAAAILCSSYEGLYAAWDYYAKGVPLRELRSLNIDAVARWYFQGMPIDGLQRVRLCTGYRYEGEVTDILPYGAAAVARCEPV